MLVLSRQRDEVIVVNGGTLHEVRFQIIDVRGHRVRVGIEAAREVPVHRQEIWDAIQRDALVAANFHLEPQPLSVRH